MAHSAHNVLQLAIGALIYAFVSGIWIIIGYFVGGINSFYATIPMLLVLVLAAVLTIWRREKDSSSSETTAEESAELGKWFGIIFAAEGVGIGVGSGILAALNLAEWIPPYVAAIVGLHFFPLGRLLNLPFDLVLGAAILLLAIYVVIALPTDDWAGVVSLGTAGLLWLAGWGRLWVAYRANQRE